MEEPKRELSLGAMNKISGDFGEENASGMSDNLDKRSFILGMVTAFSECVAGGCKRLALSPPLVHEDYDMI